ncbi:MAG TPA: retropepsin-like aspartic protease [Caulobacterales bacterium]|nr:retropepsin-like aspartic protease [Caulobacterales bacterium]
MKLAGLLAFGALAAALIAVPARADCLTETQDGHHDAAGRAVASVFVNDQGPFRFVVDTGANRSVLSTELARRLGITPFGVGQVHSVTDIRVAPLARVRSLRFGVVNLANAELPLIDGPMLAGEQGMLGFDSMSGRRLLMDFKTHCVEVLDAATAPALPNWHRVEGELRFSSMMVARGRIQGVGVNVLIDTGSDVSLCNPAFREAMGRVRARVINYRGDRAFTAGRPIVLDDAVWTPRIYLGASASVSNVMAYVGQFHIFDLWGLSDQPTVLVGMDVIASSDAMAIDYSKSTIYFRRAPRRPWSAAH